MNHPKPYDIISTCECGKKINYRTYEYQQYRHRMLTKTLQEYDTFQAKCSECFVNKILRVPVL